MTNGANAGPNQRPDDEIPSAADMDMRDEFAGRAMQGYYASGRIRVKSDPREVAKAAYDQAEAMLQERKSR
jgi:hypothetical protein